MVIAQPITSKTPTLTVAWEKLPDDFKLPDDPVDNVNQPALAAALTDSLNQAGLMVDTAFTMTNYGVCATVDGKIVVKAPDWAYVAQITVPRTEIERSYTPHLQGDVPTIVMEFLSATAGDEYSSKPTYPPGKWFYYETILQVPYYAIFEPASGDLELYQRQDDGRYKLHTMANNGLYWIESMQLFLGVWQGERENRTGYWLRWWDAQENLLLWGIERADQEAQRADQEAQRADQAAQRADRLRAQLRAAGIEPEE
ncbi:Uma2 family endonuclease [Leptothoe sp. PORK10 BA2]|uniref:Uma2 family endonuclease n=1 Tax=Leptothoe sp. PORK10 BA2 TaxID=3110254 RepID=UPI002B1EE460|nr:Uma2 family endonuclease [Leptothoe sp. PORK10 BA2]MEA5462400.1 Uma2 family endonuclease [Leptothoe sp. PORK10 BA2]